MGLLDALFGKKSEPINLPQENDRYRELIRFVAFAKRIKPMLGGNYGIYISYEAPEKGQYTSRLYATFGFYDFDEIRFAREYAIGASSVSVNMVHHYYRDISNRADIKEQEWPYGIDAYDFAEVLRGTYCESFFTLIPDEYNDDIFKLQVVGGVDSRNALLVSNVMLNVLNERFPELKITKNHATPYSMGITISI